MSKGSVDTPTLSRGSKEKKRKSGQPSDDFDRHRSSETTSKKKTKSFSELEQVDEVKEEFSPLAYTVISEEESAELLKMTVNEMERTLQKKFQLEAEDLNDAAVLDYYVGAVYWGQQQGYNKQQISIFFTIISHLLIQIKEEQVSLLNLVKEFQNMLVGMGTDPVTSEDRFFSTQQAKAITDYISLSLFQHYKLYLHLFTEPRDLKIITNEVSVEVPFPPDTSFSKSLDEGLPEEIFTRFINIPTPMTPVSEITDKDEVELSEIDFPSNAADIFGKLTPEDVKSIISEACAKVLNSLQTAVESKITKQELASKSKIEKAVNSNSTLTNQSGSTIT